MTTEWVSVCLGVGEINNNNNFVEGEDVCNG